MNELCVSTTETFKCAKILVCQKVTGILIFTIITLLIPSGCKNRDNVLTTLTTCQSKCLKFDLRVAPEMFLTITLRFRHS